MIPIHELLNRIRWDTEFGRGRFEIGYYDRHLDAIQPVAFQEVVFPSGKGQVFEAGLKETTKAATTPSRKEEKQAA